jgi:hypothetical protein
MDILYYSNHCKFSQKVIQFAVKNDLTNKMHFVCIDKRVRDPQTGQTNIVLESGKLIAMPPNIQSVPSLLTHKNHTVILGEDIINYFTPQVKETNMIATQGNGEPLSFQIPVSNSGMNIVSEKYTSYNMTADELSAKGNGGSRQMHNYVPVNNMQMINTPPDTYRPDKLSSSVTVDTLQQKRNEDVISRPQII